MRTGASSLHHSLIRRQLTRYLTRKIFKLLTKTNTLAVPA